MWSRPFGATMCKWSKEQVGGASEDARNYNRCAESASLFSARVAELRAFPLLVARQTVGALPQTLPEALPLDSARGIPP